MPEGHLSDGGKQAVTVLGLGAMGSALAETLLGAGHPVTVWNRSSGKAEPLVERGAVRAGSAAEAIAASRLVLVCLLDYRSVHEVLDAGAVSGKVLVNVTNGTPAQARELAGWAAEHDADYLDGGIMAVPPMIGGPGAFLLYSGSRAAFDTYRGPLDALGESHYLGADPGLAPLHDIALLTGMYGMFIGVLQAFALVRGENGEVTAFAPMLGRWLTAMSGFTERSAEQVDKGDYTIGVVSNLAMQAAGFGNLLAAAADRGVSAELMAPLQALMDRRVAGGHGDEDITGVIELLKVSEKEGAK
ncbi:NAD(P)-dependent oxidoreductase [Amycolatopsis sp. CA-230715]|uniref:NAD(P)-dependent oxidoreductase n=1 Tax=Amycolatopsis sp. CA-230715 TaxID=2745196 RepID=UPI001C02DD3F|nr:NAD(P)-binding domain-containing protein [Amycolatopsis sp. CA-230715]QWF78651.1 3-sulfolactaldehyde reductase [Amycolatopsis sp. CA-230715]